MGSINIASLRNTLNTNACKKQLSALVAKPVFEDILKMSNHHPGISKVAVKLAYFITPLLPSGQSTYLDLTLSQAMTEFHANYIEKGCQEAFRAYCDTIMKALPELFNFTVSGRSGNKPFLMTTWDCTRETLAEWITVNNISVCDIIYRESGMQITPRESCFLLAPQIFNRHELSFWGIPSELSALLNSEGGN